MTLSSRRRSARSTPRLKPLTTSWVYKKASRPILTTCSRASAWRGIPQATPRLSCVHLTASSSTTRCSRLYFLGDASDASQSGQLFLGPGTPCGTSARQSGQSQCGQYLPGHLDHSRMPAHCSGIHRGPAAFQRRALFSISGFESTVPRTFRQSELLEPSQLLPFSLPALRLSAG